MPSTRHTGIWFDGRRPIRDWHQPTPNLLWLLLRVRLIWLHCLIVRLLHDVPILAFSTCGKFLCKPGMSFGFSMRAYTIITMSTCIPVNFLALAMVNSIFLLADISLTGLDKPYRRVSFTLLCTAVWFDDCHSYRQFRLSLRRNFIWRSHFIWCSTWPLARQFNTFYLAPICYRRTFTTRTVYILCADISFYLALQFCLAPSNIVISLALKATELRVGREIPYPTPFRVQSSSHGITG